MGGGVEKCRGLIARAGQRAALRPRRRGGCALALPVFILSAQQQEISGDRRGVRRTSRMLLRSARRRMVSASAFFFSSEWPFLAPVSFTFIT